MYICIIGKEEADAEKLRSILAQLEYTSLIRDYSEKGILFDTHLHVPEVHEYTGIVILQREDEGHLLKVYCFNFSTNHCFCSLSLLVRELPIVSDEVVCRTLDWRGLWKLLLIKMLVSHILL